MTKRTLKIVARILFVVYLACVFTLCLWHFSNDNYIPDIFLGIPLDKWIHFLMFLPFPVLCRHSFSYRDDKLWRRFVNALCVIFAGCILAATTEFLQGLTAYRFADLADFMADYVGLFLSTVVILVIDLFTRKK